jgi:dephospho-CoA kinase
MHLIGLTGNAGSGKSTIAKVFEVMGIPCYVADEAAHRVYRQTEIQKSVIELLGASSYLADGVHNRPYIAQRVFNTPALLEKLNNIIHPAVKRDFNHWAQQQQAPYLLKEAAILFESATHSDTSGVIAVTAPTDLRMRRTIQRSGWTQAQFEAREMQQWPQDKKAAMADWVIQNDECTAVIPQAIHIHREILSRCAS